MCRIHRGVPTAPCQLAVTGSSTERQPSQSLAGSAHPAPPPRSRHMHPSHVRVPAFTRSPVTCMVRYSAKTLAEITLCISGHGCTQQPCQQVPGHDCCCCMRQRTSVKHLGNCVIKICIHCTCRSLYMHVQARCTQGGTWKLSCLSTQL